MSREFPVRGRPKRTPTHPGEILREDVLPALDLSVSEAARQLRITRQTLHRVLSGKAGISPEMAWHGACTFYFYGRHDNGATGRGRGPYA
jgi:addiction module HigA family antidote